MKYVDKISPDGKIKCDFCESDYADMLVEDDVFGVVCIDWHSYFIKFSDRMILCSGCFSKVVKGIFSEYELQGIMMDVRSQNPRLPAGYTKKVIPNSLRWEVWERDNFTCKNCGSRNNLSIDHIKSELKGGEMTMENLQTLCKKCNSKKGSK